MRRSKLLMQKRKKYIETYIKQNPDKPMEKIIVYLQNRLFLSKERLYQIIKEKG